MQEKINQILSIKGPLLYWILILVIYGIFLGLTKNYETFSALYHIALFLFPLVLIFYKKETIKSLGFQKGNVKQGVLWLSVVLILLVGGTYLRAFMLGKSVSLVFDFSFSLLMMVILAPISEEIFHRGLLQTKLEKILGETWGVVFPAVLFALIHIPKMLFAGTYVFASTPLLGMGNPLIILVSFFALGMVFGYIYQGTKSIYYAIGAHALVNLISGTFLY